MSLGTRFNRRFMLIFALTSLRRSLKRVTNAGFRACLSTRDDDNHAEILSLCKWILRLDARLAAQQLSFAYIAVWWLPKRFREAHPCVVRELIPTGKHPFFD